MREILFRGKSVNKDAGWVEGSLLITTYEPADDAPFTCYTIENTTHGIGSNSFMSGISEVVDPATVGQYTGLKDKNGVKIFEGDILEHNVQGHILVNCGVVNWDGRNGRWANQLNTMNPCFYMYKPAAYEVIGNIHDNPELVERVSNAN